MTVTRWAPALTSSGSPAMKHDPQGSWVSLEDYHDAIARAEAAEEALAGALVNLADASRARGEAEGKLAASEMAGIVEGWKARALTAEAEAERLKAAFRTNAIRWNPGLSHAEINAEIERILNQGGDDGGPSDHELTRPDPSDPKLAEIMRRAEKRYGAITSYENGGSGQNSIRKAHQDAAMYGTGILIDGKHVKPEDFYLSIEEARARDRAREEGEK